MEKFAKPGDFCPNSACPDYGKLQNGQQQNLEKFGKTRKGVQRYRCQTCHKTFTETFGTIFYGKRTPEHGLFFGCIVAAKGLRNKTGRARAQKVETVEQHVEYNCSDGQAADQRGVAQLADHACIDKALQRCCQIGERHRQGDGQNRAVCDREGPRGGCIQRCGLSGHAR